MRFRQRLENKKPEGKSRNIFDDQIDPHRQSQQCRDDSRQADSGRIACDAWIVLPTPCFHSGDVNFSCSPGRGSLSARTYSKNPSGPCRA